MVFQKRLDCAFNGYQIPAMPRVPRSAKGKRSARKKVEDNQASAFDILATLAGKLLAEREGFWTSCKEQLEKKGPLKGGSFDQGSCDESTFAPPSVSHGQISPTKQYLNSQEGGIATYAHTPVKSHSQENSASGKNFFASGSKGEFSSKSLHSTSLMKSCVCKVEDENVVQVHGKRKISGTLIYDNDITKMRNIEGPIDSERKTPVLVSSDSSVEFPPYRDCTRAQSSSFPSKKGGKELHGDKDDDDSSVCTHPSYLQSKTFKPHCLQAHRQRKLMKSSYRKADPASYIDGEVSNDDMEMKPVLLSEKVFHTRQRTPRSSSKRRKLVDRCSTSPFCGSSRDEAIIDSPAKDGSRLEGSNLLAALNGENNISCTSRGPNFLYDSEDHPVKLSIKSFKVPELFIEIPADATVGLLKRTVMESVMAILGDGLHVGVLLHGKKVRDDNKTLRQAGISYEDKMDNLGFTLEPRRAGKPSPHNNLKEPPFILSDPDPLNKFQASDGTFHPPSITIPTANYNGSDHENSVRSPIVRSDDVYSDSKALVPFPLANPAMVLSVVPFCKLRRSEINQQRRIRRPFSVSEVEALVHAVENLGTGRWRDVKLRAFDNAKHRTYVDLKDKWKTLVHTARISPQQRRGEPVPQELLDRVLSAHSFWSHQQVKLSEPAMPLLLA